MRYLFVSMLSIIACADYLPVDYDPGAKTYCSWTCQDWARNGYCDYKWNTWECTVSSEKIKNHCKDSCNICGKYWIYLYNILHSVIYFEFAKYCNS